MDQNYIRQITFLCRSVSTKFNRNLLWSVQTDAYILCTYVHSLN